MSDAATLRRTLDRIDGRGYKAYKDLQGQRYAFPAFELRIDHVQGDPFAAPSRLRVRIPGSTAGFPREVRATPSRTCALRDYLTRSFGRAARQRSNRRGSGRGGFIGIDRPGQEILDRTSAHVSADGDVEIRLVAGLPARGRRILGGEAKDLLCEDVPAIVDAALRYERLDAGAIRRHVETAEDADHLRSALAARGLVAFVPDGAILPRRSGVDDRPLAGDPVPFEAPASLRAELDRPNGPPLRGLGIPTGVTLIVGGGYHGKSTLLAAIERGIYDHVPGDGREFVVTDPAAVKIRAEDGRSVAGVDISAFIGDLPQGRSTRSFSTENASGSTSQATNIVETVEAGARVLLMDEDTSATNFMIRDHRMQELIAKDQEPITPFIDRVRHLEEKHGVSTILVMGGSGDYFDVADTVIAMKHFLPSDVTEEARAIARRHATGRVVEASDGFPSVTPRMPLAESLDPSRGKRSVQLKVRNAEEVQFGREEIDLSAVEQLVDASQVRAIAEAIVYAREQWLDGRNTLAEALDAVMEDVSRGGLDALTRRPAGDLAAFRRFELAAAINRLRTLRVQQRR